MNIGQGNWCGKNLDLRAALLFCTSIFAFAADRNSLVSQVEPNAHKIEEHRRKYDRLHKEREERKIMRERQRRRAEAQVMT